MRENPGAARMKNCDSSSFSPSRQTRKEGKEGLLLSPTKEREKEKKQKLLNSFSPFLVSASSYLPLFLPFFFISTQ